MNFADIWNTRQEDYYVLFIIRVWSDFSYFLKMWRQNFDNFFLGHTVLLW